MRQKRNYHGLTEAGLFYRERDEWLRYLTTRTEYDASTRLVGLLHRLAHQSRNARNLAEAGDHCR